MISVLMYVYSLF